ncbi:GNAT family N-acetyltransferase [Streptomyces sp. NBC_00683]|uniref:GNAT family N-acetyltransferase n=1 Tax=Streptomyces sp. NBC_00683 TaxID=2903670 RepID=UPI002E30CDD5|nr:GNAT family N-acetyltransferase [Streptomyces sp. NBC_00683]
MSRSPQTPAIDVRYVRDEDVPEWTRAFSTGYLRPSVEGAADYMRVALADDRAIGAFDKGRCVGTYRSSVQELTVPGGARLPVSAVSKVSVAGTHRRRGLLNRMLDLDLRDAQQRGEPAVVLDAAQYAIYGRYGFGPATQMAWFEIDVHRAGLHRQQSGDRSDICLVGADEYFKLAPEAYERFRVAQHGALRRDTLWWQEATGQRIGPGSTWTEPFYAVHVDEASGDVDGLMCFSAQERWGAMLPQSPLQVRDLVALGPSAERALLRYAVSMDWVSTVHLPFRAPDTLAPHWLGDPRAARITALSDFMWLRILDLPRALSARTYSTEGAVVLEVDDPVGFAHGRWLLEGGASGATVSSTSRSADIALGVQHLSSLYLGDEAATRLAELGHVEELHPGALRRADALFRTGRRPWSPRAVSSEHYGQAGLG